MAKKERTTRTSTRKVRDKWKAKQDFKVLAPEMFGGKEIADTIAGEPDQLKGRILEISLQDLTGDFSKMHIKIKCRVEKIRGNEALTYFIGHNLTSDYIRRLTRRRHSKMDAVVDVTTKDGWQVRVKPMAITEKRIQTSQEKAIRERTKEVIQEIGSGTTLSELMKSIISGDMPKKIFWRCKPIYPIKRVEVRKTQVLGRLEGAVDIVPEEPEEEEGGKEEKKHVVDDAEDEPVPVPEVVTEPATEAE